MTDVADGDGPPPFRFRIPQWLAFLFFAPIVLAIIMYYVGPGSLHGILLPEPRTLPAETMSLPGGTTAKFGGHWSLLYVGGGDCDVACKEALERTGQVHRALGTDTSRVQRFFIATSGAPDTVILAAEQPGLLVLADGQAARDEVVAALGEFTEGDVFLADPLGNVMLRFPAGTATKDMEQDLTLLLKASPGG